MNNESSQPDQATQPQSQGQLTRGDRQEIVDLLRQESADNFLQRAREIGLNLATDFAQLNLSGVDLSHAYFGSCADLTGVDLSQSNLSNANLYRAKLINANLQQANLQQSNLSSVDLSGANLREVNLSNAELTGNPNLSQTNLQQADLSNAYLNGANLTDATLEDANLQNARLHNLKLQGAKCDRANFQNARFPQEDDFSHISFKGANFANVSLYKLDFSYSDLSNANFEQAHLSQVNFSNANLQQANLQKVYLGLVNLSHANLKSANLQGAKLSGVRLEGTIIDAQTQLDPPWRKIWAIFNNQVTDNLDLSNTDLSSQDFQGMNLAGANLQSTRLFRTNFRNTNLSGADLRNASFDRELCLAGANLTDANLSGLNLGSINLSGANLQGANLNRATLINTDLSDANLQGANLDGAILKNTVINSATQLDPKWQLVWEILNNSQCGRELSEVDLSNADLTSANLENANLKGANLTGVDLSEANLLGTQIDETTNLDPMWRRAWAAVNAPQEEESSNYLIREVMPAILEPYRDKIEATIKPYLEINLVPNENLTWWQSKFSGRKKSKGGFPYLPKGYDYPKTPEGEYLHLLAQINFAEIPHLEGFPKQGILQFYIPSNHDNFYDSVLSSPPDLEQNCFRILFFSEIDLNEENIITNFDFLPEKDDFTAEPFAEKCSKIRWTKGYVPISYDNYDFYPRLLPELFNDEGIEDEIDDLWDEFEDLREEFDEACGWRFTGTNCDIQMGGYVSLYQDDPRDNLLDSNEDPFDTLLLRIRLVENGSLLFYIQSSALAKCDFSKVLYAMA